MIGSAIGLLCVLPFDLCSPVVALQICLFGLPACWHLLIQPVKTIIKICRNVLHNIRKNCVVDYTSYTRAHTCILKLKGNSCSKGTTLWLFRFSQVCGSCILSGDGRLFWLEYREFVRVQVQKKQRKKKILSYLGKASVEILQCPQSPHSMLDISQI